MTKQASQVADILEAIEFLKDALEREVSRQGGPVPVVVENRLFSSMTDAAYWLAHNRPTLWENSKSALNNDAYRVMVNLIQRVSRYCRNYSNGSHMIQCRCNEVDLNTWFLAEDGDPDTWTGGNPIDEVWPGYEDLRRK